MKKTLFTLAILCMAIAAHAIRAAHIPFAYTQSDGTTIMAYKHGHDYLAFLTSTDGVVLYPNAEGDLCYAVLENGELQPSAYVAHEAGMRSQQELDFIAQHPLSPADDTLSQMTRKVGGPHKSHVASTNDGLGEYGKSGMGSVPSIGTFSIPVIMVQFTDVQFAEGTTMEKMQRYYNEEGYHDEAYSVGSVRDYFVSQSRGMFNPTFDVVAIVTMSNDYAYYGANKNGKAGADKRVLAMLKEAIEGAIDQGVDFSQYKQGSSIPLVSLLYAGRGEADSDDENTIWPHQMDLPLQSTSYGGFIFKSYFVGNEINYYNKLAGCGTFCHEFGHALGLPDFYCTDYSYDNDSPMGNWSIMDTGGDYNHGYAPIGYTAYERSYLGWLDIRELTEAEAVTLQPVGEDNQDFAVLFRNPSNAYEYFIIENRQPGTWYPRSFGSGLLVTRFCYNRDQWYSNTLNNKQDAKRATVVTADNSTLYYSASSSNLYGYNALHHEVWTLFNNEPINDFGIYRIIKHDDGSITFNFKDAKLPDAYKPTEGNYYEQVLDASTLSSDQKIILVSLDDETALTATQADNYKLATAVNVLDDGRIIADDKAQELVLKLSLSGNWGFHTGDGYLTAAKNDISLLTTKNPSSSATASIDIVDGNAIIKFLGTNENNCISYYSTIGGFCCLPQDMVTDIQIFRKTGEDTAVKQYTANDRQSDNSVYTLMGTKTSGTAMPKGVYIVGGKKVVVK